MTERETQDIGFSGHECTFLHACTPPKRPSRCRARGSALRRITVQWQAVVVRVALHSTACTASILTITGTMPYPISVATRRALLLERSHFCPNAASHLGPMNARYGLGDLRALKANAGAPSYGLSPAGKPKEYVPGVRLYA